MNQKNSRKILVRDPFGMLVEQSLAFLEGPTHPLPERRGARGEDRGTGNGRMVCADRRGGIIARRKEPGPERVWADGADVLGHRQSPVQYAATGVPYHARRTK